MRFIKVVGQETLPQITRHLLLISITLLSGVTGIAAQERIARPVARLLSTFVNERTSVPSYTPASPTKAKSEADPTVATRSLSPSAAPPISTPPKAQTGYVTSADKAGVAESVLTPGTTEMALRVFTLVNETRAKQGLSLLAWDEKAALMANSHANNMAAARFFNHLDPQGRDAVTRARAAGLSGWRALSENIAYNKGYDQPADFAVERWLISAGHRASIMTATFTHTAVGVAVSADGRIYFTQVFLTH